MTSTEISGLVDQGYLDQSLVEKFDPYYEPSWTGDDSWRDERANDELDAYYECRRGW